MSSKVKHYIVTGKSSQWHILVGNARRCILEEDRIYCNLEYNMAGNKTLSNSIEINVYQFIQK